MRFGLSSDRGDDNNDDYQKPLESGRRNIDAIGGGSGGGGGDAEIRSFDLGSARSVAESGSSGGGGVGGGSGGEGGNIGSGNELSGGGGVSDGSENDWF